MVQKGRCPVPRAIICWGIASLWGLWLKASTGLLMSQVLSWLFLALFFGLGYAMRRDGEPLPGYVLKGCWLLFLTLGIRLALRFTGMIDPVISLYAALNYAFRPCYALSSRMLLSLASGMETSSTLEWAQVISCGLMAGAFFLGGAARKWRKG